MQPPVATAGEYDALLFAIISLVIAKSNARSKVLPAKSGSIPRSSATPQHFEQFRRKSHIVPLSQIM